MSTRNAHACWVGSLKEGGQVNFGNRLFTRAYWFTSRFEDGKGTKPKELLGAVHAGCFATALSLILGKADFSSDYIGASAHVTISKQTGGFNITRSPLICEAKVPDIDLAAFMRHADAAKAGSPVSQTLADTEITLEARLAAMYVAPLGGTP